jgi:hypothetical protein
MRLVAVFVALGALSQTALAQTPDCKSITDPTASLACYDGAAPSAKSAGRSAAGRTSTAVKPSAATADSKGADGKGYVDAISAEDALMNARLKNICRGC